MVSWSPWPTRISLSKRFSEIFRELEGRVDGQNTTSGFLHEGPTGRRKRGGKTNPAEKASEKARDYNKNAERERELTTRGVSERRRTRRNQEALAAQNPPRKRYEDFRVHESAQNEPSPEKGPRSEGGECCRKNRRRSRQRKSEGQVLRAQCWLAGHGDRQRQLLRFVLLQL